MQSETSADQCHQLGGMAMHVRHNGCHTTRDSIAGHLTAEARVWLCSHQSGQGRVTRHDSVGSSDLNLTHNTVNTTQVLRVVGRSIRFPKNSLQITIMSFDGILCELINQSIFNYRLLQKCQNALPIAKQTQSSNMYVKSVNTYRYITF